MFGNPETTTGGNALKFYSSVRMEIRSIGKLEEGTGDEKNYTGNRVKVKIVKNKVAPPFKVAEFDIMYNKGISKVGDILDLAAKYEIVKKAGAFYSYGENKIGQGRENTKTFLSLAENKKMLKEIEQDVIKMVKEKGLADDAEPVSKTAEVSSPEPMPEIKAAATAKAPKALAEKK